ncbi:hypothetical protein NPIL_385151 [Nephila pilipes]|uniref:Uncharacterized protein n=1 Tax=Nephila pilipes TaxID=299642 RepID=A0A8X6QBT8_NEPPI|nr:hypothetical protein NPIL_385151 [Nephila pilipes]
MELLQKKKVSKMPVYTRHKVTSSAKQICSVKCNYAPKNYEEYPTKGLENDDDNADEERLLIAEDVSGVKFSDCIFIDQDVATCVILNIEEMCDDAKN